MAKPRPLYDPMHEWQLDWRKTGRQDASNAIDVSELREIGLFPSAAEIAKWLRAQGDYTTIPFEDSVRPGEKITIAQRKILFDEWVKGWSQAAEEIMRHAGEELIFHDPGLFRERGWYYEDPDGDRLGPYETKAEARARLIKAWA